MGVESGGGNFGRRESGEKGEKEKLTSLQTAGLGVIIHGFRPKRQTAQSETVKADPEGTQRNVWFCDNQNIQQRKVPCCVLPAGRGREKRNRSSDRQSAFAPDQGKKGSEEKGANRIAILARKRTKPCHPKRKKSKPGN